ncbi:MAG: hypothetical protein ACYTHJ_21725 [Planctomycetota bacterium]|jgi:hypothetical protein
MLDLSQCENMFPSGTPVCVRQRMRKGTGGVTVEVIGVVESWDEKPTGSWYAHGKGSRLWLRRLTIKKLDGEITQLNIDDGTEIARIEAKKA